MRRLNNPKSLSEIPKQTETSSFSSVWAVYIASDVQNTDFIIDVKKLYVETLNATELVFLSLPKLSTSDRFMWLCTCTRISLCP